MLKILSGTFSFNPHRLWTKCYITHKAGFASVSRYGFLMYLILTAREAWWKVATGWGTSHQRWVLFKQTDGWNQTQCYHWRFPVFTEEKSDTLSMQKHAMLVVKKVSNFVNPGQTPVLEGDCPLYSRQKRCQFLFLEEVGERQIVCRIGFLHLEMCAWEVGGKLLGGSGWERMFHLANIFTPGVSASLLGDKHVRRTRNVHFITLVWLELLRQRAYDTYCQWIGPHDLHKWISGFMTCLQQPCIGVT